MFLWLASPHNTQNLCICWLILVFRLPIYYYYYYSYISTPRFYCSFSLPSILFDFYFVPTFFRRHIYYIFLLLRLALWPRGVVLINGMEWTDTKQQQQKMHTYLFNGMTENVWFALELDEKKRCGQTGTSSSKGFDLKNACDVHWANIICLVLLYPLML